MQPPTPSPFGCAHCWPPDAEAALAARSQLARDAVLIDESHYQVAILACRHCAQRFVKVFTEMIDWADGDDPAYRVTMPLTPAEADALRQRGASLTEPQVWALNPNRRSLHHDAPKGAPERVFWGTGIPELMHD